MTLLKLLVLVVSSSVLWHAVIRWLMEVTRVSESQARTVIRSVLRFNPLDQRTWPLFTSLTVRSFHLLYGRSPAQHAVTSLTLGLAVTGICLVVLLDVYQAGHPRLAAERAELERQADPWLFALHADPAREGDIERAWEQEAIYTPEGDVYVFANKDPLSVRIRAATGAYADRFRDACAKHPIGGLLAMTLIFEDDFLGRRWITGGWLGMVLSNGILDVLAAIVVGLALVRAQRATTGLHAVLIMLIVPAVVIPIAFGLAFGVYRQFLVGNLLVTAWYLAVPLSLLFLLAGSAAALLLLRELCKPANWRESSANVLLLFPVALSLFFAFLGWSWLREFFATAWKAAALDWPGAGLLAGTLALTSVIPLLVFPVTLLAVWLPAAGASLLVWPARKYYRLAISLNRRRRRTEIAAEILGTVVLVTLTVFGLT